MAAFDPVWDSLTSREQAGIIQLLVERIEYNGASGTVSITFRPTGIKTLAEELTEQSTEDVV